MEKGKFIVFEGLDGSGQSTQAELLANELNKLGKRTLLTKEPGDANPVGNEVGKIIRKKLRKEEPVTSPEFFQILCAADRVRHLETTVLPALERGDWVVSDRYFGSTLAYGYSAGIEWEWLKKLNKYFRNPDLTILLEVPSEECLKRIEKRGKKKEYFEELKQLRKVWNGYSRFATEYPHVVAVDGMEIIKKIHEVIWEVVREKVLENTVIK